MKMFKKDGLTAVLVSPGFGAGFSTWGNPEMAVDFDLVEAFLKEDMERFNYILEEKYDSPYDGGVAGLQVQWVPEGTQFMIDEYDGSESIVNISSLDTFTA